MSADSSRILSRRAGRPRSISPIPTPESEPDAKIQHLLADLAEQRQMTLLLYRALCEMSRLLGHRQRSRKRVHKPVEAHRAPRARRPEDALSPAPLPSKTEAQADTMLIAPRTSLVVDEEAEALQIRCFGRFEVLRDGAPIQQWRRSKAKTLLKYLVVRHQPVPRDILLDLLWPEVDPTIAANGLRVTLHALRQAVGHFGGDDSQDLVLVERGNFVLNPAAPLWVDAHEFSAHFESGHRLERQHRETEAMLHYEQAEAIYRDDYLVEDLYEEWTLVRREELKDQYLMVLTKLADHCLQQGDTVGCIVRCHKLIQKDVCREDAYRRLMHCYARMGQSSQAFHWYDICVRTLRNELDSVPGEQTRQLYQQISRGRPV